MTRDDLPLWAWLTFAGLVAVLLVLDLFVFNRGAREVPFREALWLSGFWVAISLAAITASIVASLIATCEGKPDGGEDEAGGEADWADDGSARDLELAGQTR